MYPLFNKTSDGERRTYDPNNKRYENQTDTKKYFKAWQTPSHESKVEQARKYDAYANTKG